MHDATAPAPSIRSAAQVLLARHSPCPSWCRIDHLAEFEMDPFLRVHEGRSSELHIGGHEGDFDVDMRLHQWEDHEGREPVLVDLKISDEWALFSAEDLEVLSAGLLEMAARIRAAEMEQL